MNKVFQKFLIAADHGGYELKELIKKEINVDWQDLGTYSEESVDYPDLAKEMTKRIDKGTVGILVCGTGQGMCMSANKEAHIRAALCWSSKVTTLAREHNDANVMCLGGRVTDHQKALKYVKLFLSTEFEGGRHGRRVDKFSKKL